MRLKKFIARKTFPLRKRLGVTPLAHRNTEEGGLSLERAFANSYAHKVNIDLFTKGENDAVGAITSLGDFIVCGWLDIRYLTREKISLNSNGETLGCEVVQCIGSKNAYGAEPTGNITRFQFIIPGYIWRSEKTDQTLKLWVSADGEYLHSQPLELSAGIMARWLENIRKYRNQYFSLLALEHLHYFNTHDSLSIEIKTYFAALALKHNLPSLPFANLLKNESGRIVTNQTLNAGIVNVALKSFNDRINLGADDALNEAEVVIEKFGLNKKDEIHFLVRLIPFFCREKSVQSNG